MHILKYLHKSSSLTYKQLAITCSISLLSSLMLLIFGLLSPVALPTLGLLTLLTVIDQASFKYANILRLCGLVIIASLLLTHGIPGFNNRLIYQNIALSEQAVPHSLYINIDKLLLGLTLLPYVIFRDLNLVKSDNFNPFQTSNSSLKRQFTIFTITPTLALGLAFSLNVIDFELKLPPEAWLFFTKMLFITVLTEELIFRGIIQQFVGERFKLWGVILISGLFFGAVHAGFSLAFALAAAIAGIGYGLTYYYTRNIIYPILLHMSVNTAHVLLFTYPLKIT